VDVDWKDLVKTIAPALASAFGTPLAGMATKVIVDTILGEGQTDVSEDEIARAVKTASPDQLIALKQASIQFQKDMAALGVDIDRLANEDRANARQREVATGDIWTPRALTLIVTLGFFGVLFFLLLKGAPAEGADVLYTMLGALATSWIACVTYYVGSTASGARKTELLAKAEALR